MSTLNICLIIFVGTIIGYALNKFPMEVIGLSGVVLLVLTGCLDQESALANFSNPNVILMAAMFVVAAGFNRTQLVNKISDLIYRVSKGSFNKMLAGYILITCLLTQFIPSPMVTFSIVFPMALAMCRECDVSPSRAMFPLCVVAVGCCAVFPIGTNAAAYAKYNGFLEAFNYTSYTVGVFDTMYMRLPCMLLILLFTILVSPRIAPKQPVVPLSEEMRGKKGVERAPLSPFREVVGYGVFILVTLALIFQKQLGVPSWLIAMAGAVAIVFTGVLNRDEAVKSMNLWMVLMYVSCLCMGTALDKTGAGKLIGDLLVKLVGGTTNGYVIGLMFFLVPFILTQFMQNQSVSNIFIPICILTCQSLGCNPVGPILLVNMASLSAYFTPMATPAVPMMMAVGGYDIKSLFKQGRMLALGLCIVSVLWTMTIFPAFP